ncbi:MAG: hypothetical protein EOP00_13490 [Pedobacter sp.]|nr:MAG: hypothetical protein EOP00_13490 [Pedobacter sp.]
MMYTKPTNDMRKYLLIISALFISCQNGSNKLYKLEIDTASKRLTKLTAQKEIELLEYFADSTAVGKPGKNKIELSHFRNTDSSYVAIRFYAKSKDNKWLLRQEFNFLKDDISGCFTELSDFNNDGFKDLTYKSAIAARGANDVRNLFIYNKSQNQLTYMKNSEDYPNMLYNKKLDCIDAFLVHGGSTTVFLKIERDSLKEFASVDIADKINIQIVDTNGNRKYLVRDMKSNFEPYTRFKNFRPLEESSIDYYR